MSFKTPSSSFSHDDSKKWASKKFGKPSRFNIMTSEKNLSDGRISRGHVTMNDREAFCDYLDTHFSVDDEVANAFKYFKDGGEFKKTYGTNRRRDDFEFNISSNNSKVLSGYRDGEGYITSMTGNKPNYSFGKSYVFAFSPDTPPDIMRQRFLAAYNNSKHDVESELTPKWDEFGQSSVKFVELDASTMTPLSQAGLAKAQTSLSVTTSSAGKITDDVPSTLIRAWNHHNDTHPPANGRQDLHFLQAATAKVLLQHGVTPETKDTLSHIAQNRIVIPIPDLDDFHYSLGIYNRTSRTMEHADSADPAHLKKGVVQKLHQVLDQLDQSYPGRTSEIGKIIAHTVPRQKNDIDCALHMLGTMQNLQNERNDPNFDLAYENSSSFSRATLFDYITSAQLTLAAQAAHLEAEKSKNHLEKQDEHGKPVAEEKREVQGYIIYADHPKKWSDPKFYSFTLSSEPPQEAENSTPPKDSVKYRSATASSDVQNTLFDAFQHNAHVKIHTYDHGIFAYQAERSPAPSIINQK